MTLTQLSEALTLLAVMAIPGSIVLAMFVNAVAP